jgi:protein-L-isoaspartate(D-aspartate) O-methyltransferase
MGTTELPTPCRGRANGAVLFWLAVAVIGGAIMASWSNVFHDFFDSAPPPDDSRDEPADPSKDAALAAERQQMVEEQLRSRDIVDPRVLSVMGKVARERFVPAALRKHAYEDHPLPIGLDQTISQPYIVALMTQLADPKPGDRALEIGVGSGYQAAVLAELCKEVYGVEILEPLATAASQRLARLGYKNVTVRCGDGHQGWAEHAPFDVILVTAAPDHVPQPLLDQLASGGRLVIPVGVYYQDLLLVEKRPDGTIRRRSVAPVRFVPMTGESEKTGSRGSDQQ